MRSPVIALALTFAVSCGGYVFAADDTPQPLTRADCDAAGMTWNDGTNVCGGSEATAADASAPAGGEQVGEAQPLTRADCEAAGLAWNDEANVCGSGATAQPLTHADCEAAGMRWNDNRNVCDVGTGAAAKAAKAAKAAMAGKTTTKVVKKVMTKHGTTKIVKKKTHHAAPAAKSEKGGFFKWLKKNQKKS